MYFHDGLQSVLGKFLFRSNSLVCFDQKLHCESYDCESYDVVCFGPTYNSTNSEAINFLFFILHITHILCLKIKEEIIVTDTPSVIDRWVECLKLLSIHENESLLSSTAKTALR